MTTETNPVGLRGLAFLEYSATPEFDLGALFRKFGFSRTHENKSGGIDLYKQSDIVFLLDQRSEGFAASFREAHGPSISGMGLFVEDAKVAFETAVARGGRAFTPEGNAAPAYDARAIWGIGDSLIYFIDESMDFFAQEFTEHSNPETVKDLGFTRIDHMTNNVYQGTLKQWSDFYKDIFGFTEVRHFDIRGEETGLFSYALRSPDGSFCIPINEGTEEKSQIEEYLREYNGPGIQHVALSSEDLLGSLDAMQGSGVEFLDIDDEYYAEVFNRVPNVTEDHQRIKAHNVLVDGDDEGYLLQIFTQNQIGPIFFELIQRKNHESFGEGNFGALFRSIERDQRRRGVL